MRTTFIKTLTELAAADPRIMLVVGDLGFGVVTDFAKRFPDQFLNVGVAEQNMTGVAAGLALAGRIPFTYSIANFPTLRCLEQIRNDVCYHNANVKIVIIGGGLAYGPLGVSHQATEDIAIMRALPNKVVFCPCDFAEAEAGVHAMIAQDGPFYYRCGYKMGPPVHAGKIEFRLGQAIQVRDGSDATIFFTGTIGNQVLPAADALDRIHLKDGTVFDGKIVGKSTKRYLLGVDMGGKKIYMSFFMDEIQKVELDEETAKAQIPFLKEVENFHVSSGTGKDFYEMTLFKDDQSESVRQEGAADRTVRFDFDEQEAVYHERFGQIQKRYARKFAVIQDIYANLTTSTKDDFLRAKSYMEGLVFELENTPVPEAFKKCHALYLLSAKAGYQAFDALEQRRLDEAAAQTTISEDNRTRAMQEFRRVVLSRQVQSPTAEPLSPR